MLVWGDRSGLDVCRLSSRLDEELIVTFIFHAGMHRVIGPSSDRVIYPITLRGPSESNLGTNLNSKLVDWNCTAPSL